MDYLLFVHYFIYCLFTSNGGLGHFAFAHNSRGRIHKGEWGSCEEHSLMHITGYGALH